MASPFTFAHPVARALGHLLESEPWARERLAPFAGEAIELRAPLLPPLCLAIGPEGRISAAPAGQGPALIVAIQPEALPAAVRGEEHLLQAIHVTGNARLASEVMFLARHLRWDVEEDLSRLVGDVAAHRMVGTAKTLVAWHADAARRLAEGALEYATEEAQILVRRGELADVTEAQARLRDGLERLEKRIERLER